MALVSFMNVSQCIPVLISIEESLTASRGGRKQRDRRASGGAGAQCRVARYDGGGGSRSRDGSECGPGSSIAGDGNSVAPCSGHVVSPRYSMPCMEVMLPVWQMP